MLLAWPLLVTSVLVMLEKILTVLLAEYPHLRVLDGRLYVDARDVTEPIEILLDAIEAEPERVDELVEQSAERVEFHLDPEAYAKRYLKRPALA